MFKIASSIIIRTKFEGKYLIIYILCKFGGARNTNRNRPLIFEFSEKKLLCRIISDAAFSWPELMDEGKEEQGGGTVDKPYITVVVERATFLI